MLSREAILAAIDDIEAQQEVWLAGRWIRGMPTLSDQGCAIIRPLSFNNRILSHMTSNALHRLSPLAIQAMTFGAILSTPEFFLSNWEYDGWRQHDLRQGRVVETWNDINGRQFQEVYDASVFAINLLKGML